MSEPVQFLKTTQVAKLLGVPYWQVHALVRWERIPLPPRDGSGDYVWMPADVERAREALRKPEGAEVQRAS